MQRLKSSPNAELVISWGPRGSADSGPIAAIQNLD